MPRFGSTGHGIDWDPLEDTGWVGTGFVFPTDVPEESYWDLLTAIPPWQDPSGNMIQQPLTFRAAVNVKYEGATPTKAYAYLNIAAVSGAGRLSMAVYDTSENLMGYTNWVTLTETGVGWYEFTFESASPLVDGVEYIIAIGASFNALQDWFSVADGAAGDDPVLPLLKTNSGSEAGLLR